jgi:hypothetical protein
MPGIIGKFTVNIVDPLGGKKRTHHTGDKYKE